MERNDKQQKRVLKKESLDDTVYNIKIDDILDDEFYKDEQHETYTPGIDDVDHFDFSAADEDRFRERNQEEAERREQRRQKRRKKKKKLEAEKKELLRAQKEKKKTNKEIMRVTYVMLLMLFGVIGYLVYFQSVVSPNVINNPHNALIAKLAEEVVRGEILSADGNILAQSTDDNGDGTYTRTYPYGRVYAHVVGTLDINKSGIELSEDYDLISADVNPLEKILNEIQGTKNQGNDVMRTLNSTLQQAAYDALGDQKGAVVAIEPSTGKILAMVSKPDYDPNTLSEDYENIVSDSESKALLNQATQGLFAPGSIFKIATTLAYIRQNPNYEDYSYYCDGSIRLSTAEGSTLLKCYDGEVHGTVNLADSFAHSCNSSFANIGLSLNLSQYTDTCNSLLFNTALPTSLTTSNSGFSLDSSASQWLIGATAIGQGNTTVTPMHMAMITSAIANGGTLMEPYVVDSLQSSSGMTVEKYMPENYGSLMTASEASTLTNLMKGVTSYGTGYKLSGLSYSVAGKTGTAQVDGSGNNTWFVGFAPADNPQIALCVLIEDTAGTSGQYAVPVAKELFGAYLGY